MMNQSAEWSRRARIIVIAALLLAPPMLAQKTRAVGKPSGPSLDCKPAELQPLPAQQCRAARLLEGERLFDSETFGGNGRTCRTCHSKETGTFSPADAQARLTGNPSDPLFLHDGSDDGSSGTGRVTQRATIRVTLPLPPHLRLADDPAATTVTLNRGTPTTKNTPALDTSLMADLRAQTLQIQAAGAIEGHAQGKMVPTPLQLDLIAEFERTGARFFSDGRLLDYATSGVPPLLPLGTTESEKRGRKFFEDIAPRNGSMAGACAICHSGPMLNETNRFAPPLGIPEGMRIQSAGVSERNRLGNPVYKFELRDALGTATVFTPDPGILMSDPALPGVAHELSAKGPKVAMGAFANFFKIPTLWGVKDTAPYFHDNSAGDLDELLEHYNWFFENLIGLGPNVLKPQDIADIKAFLELL
jgi:hypothetical protein